MTFKKQFSFPKSLLTLLFNPFKNLFACTASLIVFTAFFSFAYAGGECPEGFPSNAVCERISLPEDYSQPTAGQISIPIVRLLPEKSETDYPLAILGGGGPGGGLELKKSDNVFHLNEYRKLIYPHGELILIDQRGAGDAQPRLSCPTIKALVLESIAKDLLFSEKLQTAVEAYQHCYQRFQDDGVKIEAYSTLASAKDMDLIREKLGFQKWNILGFSYGSRLALEMLRQNPDTIRSAILESVLPFDHESLKPNYPFSNALKKIDAVCRTSADCQRHGSVLDNLNTVLANLKTKPIPLTVTLYSKPISILLTPDRLLEIVHLGIYSDLGVRALPLFLRELANKRYDNKYFDTYLYIYVGLSLDEEWAEMLGYAISCREYELNRHSKPQNAIEVVEFNWNHLNKQICQSSPFPTLAQIAPQMNTDIPILIVSGDFDPATPIEWGEDLLTHLKKGQLVAVPSSHTPSFSFPCLQTAINHFLAKPDHRLADFCQKEQIQFF